MHIIRNLNTKCVILIKDFEEKAWSTKRGFMTCDTFNLVVIVLTIGSKTICARMLVATARITSKFGPNPKLAKSGPCPDTQYS
jgi:hypothetical protein